MLLHFEVLGCKVKCPVLYIFFEKHVFVRVSFVHFLWQSVCHNIYFGFVFNCCMLLDFYK